MGVDEQEQALSTKHRKPNQPQIRPIRTHKRREYVPYIVAEPEVTVHELDPRCVKGGWCWCGVVCVCVCVCM